MEKDVLFFVFWFGNLILIKFTLTKKINTKENIFLNKNTEKVI